MAFLVEKAGGASRTAPRRGSALDAVVESPYQRCDVCLGSPADVALFDQLLVAA